MQKSKNILYISYDGVMEPLGQSQVIGYLNNISKEYNCFLISFEKTTDLLNKIKFRQSKDYLFEQNIRWIPLKYHKRFKILSTLFDMFIGAIKTFAIMRSNNIHILHIRGYIPMLIVLMLRLFYSSKVVFDMRGFWPDEKADRAGWSRLGMTYKFFKFLEKKFILIADAIVVLTDESKKIITSQFTLKKNTQVIMIPTCVDLDLFSISNIERNSPVTKKINIASLGSVDTAYDIDPLMYFFKDFLKFENANLIFFNKDSHDLILSKAIEHNIPEANIIVKSVERENIPSALSQIDLGIFYLKKNFSIKASMPTKIGEFLSMGKPFMCNNFNKDIEGIVDNNRIGFLHNFNEPLSNETIQKLRELMFAEDTSLNCLKFAVSYFSLEEGSKQYLKAYSELLN